MLNYTTEILLILSIIVPLTILRSILTYKKEVNKNERIWFLILLALIYIIVKISRDFNISETYSNNMRYLFNIIIFIVLGIYYKYFYNIGLPKYAIIFCVFSMYYELIYDILYRGLFLPFTGSVVSSKEALLVSQIERTRIYIYCKLSIIFIYMICKLVYGRLQLISQDKRNYVYLIFALIINSIGIVSNLILMKLERTGVNLYSERYVFDQYITPKLILASSIVLILLFGKIIKENKLKSQNEIIKNKLDLQYAHYISMQESHMKVKKLYHDINNHIYCIDNLKNNSTEINEYINSLKDEVKEFKSIYNTGNMILDIIINEKSEICFKKGIKFICDINFVKVSFIKPIDVSSIFANILDNAIEACDKIADEKINKYIRIKGTISKSYFVLKCENSKVNNIRIDKNRFLTDKKDKFIHGLGIQSIKSSLQKYDGEIVFEEEEDKFILKIYIPLNQNTDSWVD